MPKPTDVPLNYNPFSNDFVSFVRDMIKNEIYNIQTCIPANVSKVISRNKVTVSPSIKPTNSMGELVNWADVTLPVYTPQGGNLIISLPIKKGDPGWIIAGDLDPSMFLKNPKQPAGQNTYQRHQYQFGFFVPCKLTDYKIDDNDALVIQTADGGTKISIKEGHIDIVSQSQLNINASNVTINGTDWATHTHNVGTLTVPTTAPQGSPSVISGATGGVAK